MKVIHLLRGNPRSTRLACGALRTSTHRTSLATDDVTCKTCCRTAYFAQIRAEEQGTVACLEAR